MPKSATLGFIGKGDVSARNVKALLTDELEQVTSPKFILPITKDHWTETLADVAQYAIKNDIPFEAVTDDSTAKLKDAKDVLGEALKTHKVARVTSKLVGILADSPNPKLVIAWDDEDDEAVRAFTLADKDDIDAYDFCSGLDKLRFGEPEPENEPEDDEPRGRSRDEEPEDEPTPQPMTKYTKAELEKLDFNELKDIAAAMKIEVPNRTRTPGYIQRILDAQDGETAEIEHVVPEEADDSGTEDEREEEIPEELEPPDAVEGSLLDIDAAVAEAWGAVKKAKVPEHVQGQAFGFALQLALDNAYRRLDQ